MVVTSERPGDHLHIEDVTFDQDGRHHAFFYAYALLVFLLAGPGFVAPFIPSSASLGDRIGGLFLSSLIAGIAAVPAWYYLRRNLALRSLTIDEERKVWTVEEWSTFHLLGHQWKVPLTNVVGLHITGMNLTEARLGKPLQLRTQLLLAGGKGFHWRFPIDGLETREGLLDLAHRMGSAVGLPAYQVLANNPRVLALAMRRPGPEHAAVKHEPVVRPAAPAPYAHAKGEPHDALSKEVVPTFRPERYESVSPFQVDVWKPGERVQLSQPWQVPSLAISLVGAALVLGGAVWLVGYLRDHPQEPKGPWWIKYGVFLVMTLPIHLMRFCAASPMTVVIDWAGRRLDSKSIGTKRSVSFDDLTWIETRRIVERTSRSSDPDSIDTHYNYRVETWAHTRSDAIEIGETTNDHSDLERVYALALPLGVEVARALGVPHKYRGA